MKIQLKLAHRIIFTSIFCGALTACGGSDGDHFDKGTEGTDYTIVEGSSYDSSLLKAGTINSNNYLSVFQEGVSGSAELLRNVMFTVDVIDTDALMVLDASKVGSITYACDNIDGTMRVDQVDGGTQMWVFDHCHMTKLMPDTLYHGAVTIVTTMSSGSFANVGSYDHDWSAHQLLIFDNYTETSPSIGGSSVTSNGKAYLSSSNDITTQKYMNVLSNWSSWDDSETGLLSIDSVNPSGVATSYEFGDISYVFSENSDATVYSSLEFTADISGIGSLDMTTKLTSPVVGLLKYDVDGNLISGAGLVRTASSTAKIISTVPGGNVEVFIDSENDGSFEAPILTTWTALGGL